MSIIRSFNFVFHKNFYLTKYLIATIGIGFMLIGVFHLSDSYTFEKHSFIFKMLFHSRYILINMGAFIFIFSFIFHKKHFSNYDNLDFMLFIFIFIILIFYSIFSQIRFLDNDEYEHLHNAWMMREHTIPYFSIRFKHSPLLEWIISFFMIFQDESTLIIRTMRIFMFLLSCCSLYLIYQITEKIFKSQRHSLVCIFLILCNFVWLEKSFEIRPDNIMVFFALVSFLFLILFHESNNFSFLFLFIISAILSFLGKQNAIIFYFSLGFILTYKFLKSDKFSYTKIAIVSFGFLSVFFFLSLVPQDILLPLGFKHIIPNDAKFWPTNFLKTIFKYSPAIFILFIIQLFNFIKLMTCHPTLKAYLLSISIITLAFLFLMNRPWLQEMIIMTIFMAMIGSNILIQILKKKSLKVNLLIMFLILITMSRHTRTRLGQVMTSDLIITKTILEIADKNDLVFDAYGKPIFRHHPLEPKYLQYFSSKFSRLDELKESKVKFLIKDGSYYPRFPKETRKWFDENFVPVKENQNIFIRKMD